MSKSKALHWPVLVARSLAKPGALPSLYPSTAPFTTGATTTAQPCINPHGGSLSLQELLLPLAEISHLPSRAIRSSSLSLKASSASPLPCARSSKQKASSVTHTMTTSSRKGRTMVESVCSCGYYTPLLPTLAQPRIPGSGARRIAHRQSRGVHSNSQTRENVADQRHLSHNMKDGHSSTSQLSDTLEPVTTLPYTAPKGRAVKARRRKRVDPASKPTSGVNSPSRNTVALSNFRLLIHSDHALVGSLQSESRIFHKELLARQSVPSSIVPPLMVLQQLFSSLESNHQLDQLLPADWTMVVFWLFHHKDHATLAHIRRHLVDHKDLGEKCGDRVYTTLAESILIHGQMSEIHRSTLTQGARLEQNGQASSATKAIQEIVENMHALQIPRTHEMYSIWLRAAVQERNWSEGINAWNMMKLEKRSIQSPSVAAASDAVRCFLHSGLMAEAASLFESIVERSMAAQVQDKQSVSSSSGSTHRHLNLDGKGGEAQLTPINDAKSEYLKRQANALQELEQLIFNWRALQERVWTGDSLGFAKQAATEAAIQEWNTLVYPPLIEAISLGPKDEAGASAAAEMLFDLVSRGHVLNKRQFRTLARFIGESSSKEHAERFLERWMDTTKSLANNRSTSVTHVRPTPMVSPDGGDIGSAADKELRRVRRTTETFLQNLTECGLQELVKISAAEGDFERAKALIRSVSAQGMSLGVIASEQLIVGLTKRRDIGSALAVLERLLLEKKVPSMDTINKLLSSLIRQDRLDESVAVFRDLTENYGVKPDMTMYRSMMNLTSKYGLLPMAQRIMSTLKALGVKQDGELYRDLMRCYVRSNNLPGAIKVFEEMEGTGVKNEIQHINVLLEGAVRHSTSLTVLGILEIMGSLKIRPTPETWNILLSGAFQDKDRMLALELFQELSRSVTWGQDDHSDGSIRSARHPETFQLLLLEYAQRHGVEPALKILQGAIEAQHPRRVSTMLFRELMEESCHQGKGVIGYEYFRLLQQSEKAKDGPAPLFASSGTGRSSAYLTSSPSSTASSVPSWSVSSVPLSSAVLYRRLLKQLAKENANEKGRDMASDLIVSGFEMDSELIQSAIGFYGRCGELTAAFGLFMKMGRAYGVQPTREMVWSLVDASVAQGIIAPLSGREALEREGSSNRDHYSLDASLIKKWDEAEVQQWKKILKVCVDGLGSSG